MSASAWKSFLAREKAIFVESWRIVVAGWRWILLITALTLTSALLLHAWDPVLRVWIHTHQQEAWLPLARSLSLWGKLERAPLIALILLFAAGYYSKKPAWVCGAMAGVHAGVIGGILVNIFKVIGARPRPATSLVDGFYWFRFGGDFASFPSGHATHCLAIVAAVALFAPRYAALLTLASLGVMWSRWYLERHYVTDLFSGAMLGITVGVILGMAVRRAYLRNVSASIPKAEEVGQ